MKPEVVFLGLSRAELLQRIHDKKSLTCCFRCKRGDDEESAYITDKLRFKPLEMRRHEVENGQVMVVYFVCVECLVFLGSFLEQPVVLRGLESVAGRN